MTFTNERCPECINSKHVRTFDDVTFYCVKCNVKFDKNKEGVKDMGSTKKTDPGKSGKDWKRKR